MHVSVISAVRYDTAVLIKFSKKPVSWEFFGGVLCLVVQIFHGHTHSDIRDGERETGADSVNIQTINTVQKIAP